MATLSRLSTFSTFYTSCRRDLEHKSRDQNKKVRFISQITGSIFVKEHNSPFLTNRIIRNFAIRRIDFFQNSMGFFSYSFENAQAASGKGGHILYFSVTILTLFEPRTPHVFGSRIRKFWMLRRILTKLYTRITQFGNLLERNNITGTSETTSSTIFHQLSSILIRRASS